MGLAVAQGDKTTAGSAHTVLLAIIVALRAN